jgi:hypothetical protein
MDAGGTLYVDFWDTKQPGIFAFYWIAGRLFGFTTFGVHLFELLWLLVLGAWMIRALRPHLEIPELASIVPIASIGGYYAVAGTWELSQAEIVVSLPLFACLAAIAPAYGSAGRLRAGWFAAGIAAGIVAAFKLMFAPIPVALWVVASAVAMRTGEADLRAVVRDRWLPATAGVVLVLGAVALAFAAAGGLEALLWTSFAYPFQVMTASVHMDVERLLLTDRWFLGAFAPLVLFALLARVRHRGDARERVFSLALIWWIVAVLVILAQTLSWWRYHFMLLLVPTAILAARGIDGLLSIAQRRLPHGRAAVALLLTAAACAPAWRVWIADSGAFRNWVREPEHEIRAYQSAVSPAWNRITRDTEFLRAEDARPGPIYVFGDPRAILLARREQAIPINGWSWESYADRQWQALPGQLAAATPAYIGVEPAYETLVRERAPDVWAWIEANYRLVKPGEQCDWYERAEGRAP